MAAGQVRQQVLTVLCAYVCVLLTRHLQTLVHPGLKKEPVRGHKQPHCRAAAGIFC